MDFLIGDIHGCWEELQELLQKAGPGPDDRIIAVGDIVDRGPDSRKVVEFFTHTPNALSLMGNHERKHLASRAGLCAPALSQLLVKEQLGAEYDAFIDVFAKFPLFLVLEGAITVHGFFEPGVPLAEQRENVLCGVMSGERYLENKYGRPWYERYEGPPLIVGHHDYRGDHEPLVHRDLVYGIDTGCCRGGRLTGLILPGFRFVSVPARANYWAAATLAARQREGAYRGVADMPWPRLRRRAQGADPRSASHRRVVEAAEGAVARLVAAAQACVSEWLSGSTDPTEAGHIVHERARPGHPHAWVFHLAAKGKLRAEILFDRFRDPQRLFDFLRAFEDLVGPVPELSHLLGPGKGEGS